MSPELFDPGKFGLQDSRPTKESDCYALGMVIYEVLSRQIPFASYRSATIIWKVISGERPKRPQGEESVWFTDDLWGILELCWEARPGGRPNIEAVLECLGRISWPSPSMGDELGSTARNSCMFIIPFKISTSPPILLIQQTGRSYRVGTSPRFHQVVIPEV